MMILGFVVLLVFSFCLSVRSEYMIDVENGEVYGPLWMVPGQYRYFGYTFSQVTGITLILDAPSTGNIDMYASCSNRYPDYTSHDWMEHNTGAPNSIFIPSSSLLSGGCKAGGQIFFSSYLLDQDGSGNAWLIAYSQNTTVSLFLNRDYSVGDGQPGLVQENDYYVYEHTKDEMNITISADVAFGNNVGMFVGIGYVPDQFHHDYSAYQASGKDSVTFSVRPGQKVYVDMHLFKGEGSYRINVKSQSADRLKK